MLSKIEVENIGPFKKQEFHIAMWANIFAGDENSGKTFLLNLIWSMLTGFNKKKPLHIANNVKKNEISVARAILSEHDPHEQTYWLWDKDKQKWDKNILLKRSSYGDEADVWEEDSRCPIGQVNRMGIYARDNGDFSIFISSLKEKALDISEKEALFGIENFDRSRRYTRVYGLVEDLSSMQRSKDSEDLHEFCQMAQELLGDPVEVKSSIRLDSDSGCYNVPIIKIGEKETPLTLLSRSILRILCFVYLFFWCKRESENFAESSGTDPVKRMFLFIDSPENGLHPKIQKKFLASIIRFSKKNSSGIYTQTFSATNSPIVLASIENLIDGNSIFHHLALGKSGTEISSHGIQRTGSCEDWLASRLFGKMTSRSEESQIAIDAAMDFMAGRYDDVIRKTSNLAHLIYDFYVINEQSSKRDIWEYIDCILTKLIPSHDTFLVRWKISSKALIAESTQTDSRITRKTKRKKNS